MKQLVLSLLWGVFAFFMGVLLLRNLAPLARSAETPPEPAAASETALEAPEETKEAEILPLFSPRRASFDTRFHLPVSVEGELVSMSLRDYVLGAVLGEMPTSFAPEALKAQAVACRTYAMRQYTRRKHGAAAVCTDPGCCMNWIDPEAYGKEQGDPSLKAAETAVEETDGMVIFYGEELITATFFSSSGGRTENAADVWGGELPYLHAVDSPGEASPWNDAEVTLPQEEFVSVLQDANEMAMFPGNGENWIGELTYTEGGGVATAELGGCIYTGVQLRRLFHLRSTLFSLERVGDTVVFTTHGFGHRVGLSQYGAEAMAERGCSYQEILQWYYQGTQIRHMEEDA